MLLTFQDSKYPEDESRCFLLTYFLANDEISIYEKFSRNSGFIGHMFLKKTRIPKPGTSVDEPEFYSPADFAIGATVEGEDHSGLPLLALLQMGLQKECSLRHYSIRRGCAAHYYNQYDGPKFNGDQYQRAKAKLMSPFSSLSCLSL